MTYLNNENVYQELVAAFLAEQVDADAFVGAYFAQWKMDRDAQWEQVHAGYLLTADECALSDVLDDIFLACDAYSPCPEGEAQINARDLRQEVDVQARKRWRGAR